MQASFWFAVIISMYHKTVLHKKFFLNTDIIYVIGLNIATTKW